MKLEAVSPQDMSSIGPASIKQVYNDYFFLVEIDNFLGGTALSYWCSAFSSGLFPTGWCGANGIHLVSPAG